MQLACAWQIERYEFPGRKILDAIAMLGGDVSKFVAPSVLARLHERVSRKAD